MKITIDLQWAKQVTESLLLVVNSVLVISTGLWMMKAEKRIAKLEKKEEE